MQGRKTSFGLFSGTTPRRSSAEKSRDFRAETLAASQSSGFGETQLNALKKTAIATKCVLFARPANPVTNVTEMIAVLLGYFAVYKSMMDKSKSGALGGALKTQKSVRRATFSAKEEEAAFDDAILDNFTKQKQAALEYMPASVVSLDLLHYLQRINRLEGHVTLLCEEVTLKNADNPEESSTAVAYYLEFKFNEIFRSSKNNKIRIRIPEEWAKPEYRSMDCPADKYFKQIKATILTDSYEARLADFEATTKSVEDLARPAAPEEIPTLLSHQIPPALFRIPREGKTELQIRSEWQRLFEDSKSFKRVLDPHLFTLPEHRRPRIAPTFDLKATTLVHEAEPQHATQLKSYAQSTMLPMGTPFSYQDEDSPTLPWPSQLGFKLLLVDGVLTPALMCSDLDMAGIAYPKEKDKRLDITLMDLAAATEGEVTGVGLKADADVIHTLNQQYLLALKEFADKYKDTLEGDFYHKQFTASIIAAHHGAENLNPYATIETVEQAFAEGFIFIDPKGNAVFALGKPAIFEKLNALATVGWTIPISTAWYTVLAEYAAKEKKPALHSNVIPVDAAAHATKKSSTPKEKEIEETQKAEAVFQSGVYFDYDKCLVDGGIHEDYEGYKVYAQGIHSVFKELHEWAETGREITLPHEWYLAFLEHIREREIEIPAEIMTRIQDGGSGITSFTISGLEFIDAKRKAQIRKSTPKRESASAASAGSSFVFAPSPTQAVILDHSLFVNLHLYLHAEGRYAPHQTSTFKQDHDNVLAILKEYCKDISDTTFTNASLLKTLELLDSDKKAELEGELAAWLDYFDSNKTEPTVPFKLTPIEPSESDETYLSSKCP